MLSTRFVVAVLLGGLLVAATGCAVTCIEDAAGTKCTAKSLKRYEGAPPAPQLLDRAPGSPLTVDVQYGNVLLQRSGSGKVEVQFMPYVFAGHDEQQVASQMLAQNLVTTAAVTNGTVVTVRRNGGTNGLGADVVVRVPDGFDGPITVVNRGDGPINDFDVKLEYVGRASALAVTNQSLLGGCWIQGAPTVRSTTVQCGSAVSVFDVSDSVSIASTDRRHDEPTPTVTVRMASIAPNGPGGKISSASGAVSVTFPRAGGYVLNASSPVKGVVQEGALPPNCSKRETSPSAKVVTCGAGPSYQILAGTSPDTIGQPRDNNVVIAYQ
jgi:hypothetical protein